MPSTTTAPFRFRDLPLEIRNKVYRNLLCEFSPPPTTIVMDPTQMLNFQSAHHSIETAILCTSADTYREAYDVMVKTNRFVKITSMRGLYVKPLLLGFGVPVVTEDENAIERFSGYVLAVDLASKKQPEDHRDQEIAPLLESFTLMILFRDMGTFCKALTDGDAHTSGYSDNLQISITVAPVLNKMPHTRYTPSFGGFFSEKTQQALLAPFRARLRGFKAVTISGVEKDFGNAVRDEMGREQSSDPESILAEMSSAKEDGSRLFKERKDEEACLRWQDAVVDVDKIYESSSWASLVGRGGDHFVAQLAELYFLMQLNIAHIQITSMQSPQLLYFAGLLAENALNSATRSLKKDYWMKDYKYRPSIKHLAKLRYRFAIFLRLQDEPGTEGQALTHINKALRLQPGDAAILRERNNIIAWMQQT